MSVGADRPTLPGFNPMDPDFLRDPFPTWTRAQAEAPVFFYPDMNFWVITRFDDVLAAATDHETFSSKAFEAIDPPADMAAVAPRELFGHVLVANDPPEHTSPRKAANKGFTRSRVAAMEGAIREVADALIDGFAADGRCDLMTQYCYPLSMRTIVRLLGLDESDEALKRYRQWTEHTFSLVTPKSGDRNGAGRQARTLPEDEIRRRWSGLSDAAAYYRQVIDERRAAPGDDMVSALLRATGDDGRPLTDQQVTAHIQSLMAAGNDTTANLMGSLVLYLSQQPEDFAEVKAHPELLPQAVEEGLRRRGSSVGMFRLATRDVTVAGVTIPEGSIVFLAFQATGHDPAYFPDARRVDIHRENASEHLAFGRGRHFCLGAPLARLEARAGLETLFARLPGLQVVADQPLHFAPTFSVSMLAHLEVVWD